MMDSNISDIDLDGIIPSDAVSLPKFNVIKLYDYCKKNDIPLSEVTSEMMKTFE